MLPPDVAEAYRGRRVLVTGGLGFIGSTLAHRLVELGAEVVLVSLPLYPELTDAEAEQVVAAVRAG